VLSIRFIASLKLWMSTNKSCLLASIVSGR
jgi:hypothetical protein